VKNAAAGLFLIQIITLSDRFAQKVPAQVIGCYTPGFFV
jgi:hypothetical protein